MAAERPCDLAQSSVGTGSTTTKFKNVLSDSSCPQAPNWRFSYIKSSLLNHIMEKCSSITVMLIQEITYVFA